MIGACEDGYLAGLFDGEGTVGLYQGARKYTLLIQIQMINKDVLKRFQERFGGSLYPVSMRGYRQRGMRARDVWKWQATGSKGGFLHTVLPYVTEKRTQVDLALRYIDEFGEGRIGGGAVLGRPKRTPEQKARQHWYHEEFKRLKQENGKLSEVPAAA